MLRGVKTTTRESGFKLNGSPGVMVEVIFIIRPRTCPLEWTEQSLEFVYVLCNVCPINRERHERQIVQDPGK